MSVYTYTKTEIYIEKTILEYDEFNNVIARNVYYDKEVKYNKIPPKIQPTNITDKYYSYKLINSIPINTSSNISPTSSMQTSPNVSPTSSMPPSPTDSVIIDMSKLLYSK
jgi:hypothetical protein